MLTDDPANDAAMKQLLLTSRVIAGALPAGVILFVAVAIFVRVGPPSNQPFVALVGVVFAGAILPLRMVVLGILGRRRNDSPAPETLALLRQYQVRMIVGLAMLEGAALFNTVAFLLEGHWWSLVVVGVLLALMLTAFPTRMAVEQWVEDRKAPASFRTT